MSRRPDPRIAYLGGDFAAPRKNGELVFEAPWQGRAFGMAVALCDQERCDWEAFRQRLISEIASAEQRGEDSGYYERWLRALESLVLAEGMLTADEIETRVHEYETGERDEDE